jgi:hypothetical protein
MRCGSSSAASSPYQPVYDPTFSIRLLRSPLFERNLRQTFFFFFFFFYWRYNPLSVLAFSVILFLSLHNFLHPLIPILCISSSTSSIHLFLGLPQILLLVGFQPITLLGVLFSSIRIT